MNFNSDADKQEYIKTLRDAGFKEHEIAADIESIGTNQTLPVAPPAPVVQPSSRAGGGGSPITQPEIAAAPLAPAAPREAVTALKEVAQARDEQNMNLTDQVLNSTIGKVVTGALGLYGAYKGGQALLNTDTAQGLKKRFFTPPPEAVAIDRSIDIQMNEPSSRLPAAAQQTEAQFRASLSPTEQALYAKAQADKAAPTANISNEPYAASKVQLFPDEQLTPEQIRMNKQAAATQAIQQNLGAPTAAPPPVNTPKKVWEPPTASLALNAPATPTQTAATTTAETPAPKATLEQQVKAIKETATPSPTPEKQPPEKAPPKPKMKLPEGWGKGMSWLTAVHGVDGARAFIDQYNDGKPFATHKEMDDKYREVTIRPKYSDIPKDIRKERRIPLRVDLTAVPPPSLRPSEIGQGGGSLIRSLTDPLQLKQ